MLLPDSASRRKHEERWVVTHWEMSNVGHLKIWSYEADRQAAAMNVSLQTSNSERLIGGIAATGERLEPEPRKTKSQTTDLSRLTKVSCDLAELLSSLPAFVDALGCAGFDATPIVRVRLEPSEIDFRLSFGGFLRRHRLT